MKRIKYIFYLFSFPVLLTAQNHFVQNEGHFVLEAGFLVLENSHFTNNATLGGSDGTVKMTGAASDGQSTIGGTSTTTFTKLLIEKSSNNVQLNQHAEVDGSLTLAGGLLNLQNFDLSLLNTANAIAGASNIRYLQTSGTGEVKINVGSSEETFPVGNSSFNPLKITNSGTSDLMGVRVEDQVLDNLTFGETVIDASVNRVWQVSESTAGGSNLAINLQWNGGEELVNFDGSLATFATYETDAWVAKAMGAAIGSDPYNFTGTNIANAGAFSIANVVCQLNGVATLGVLPPRCRY